MATGYTLESGSSPSGRRLRLAGSLTLADGHLLWRDVSRALAGDDATEVAIEVDCAGITRIDGGSAALLAALFAGARNRGAAVEIVGATRQTGRMLDLYDCRGGVPCAIGEWRQSRRAPGDLPHIGPSYLGDPRRRARVDDAGNQPVPSGNRP
jgi:ABC-type transporter Mla MlaB component